MNFIVRAALGAASLALLSTSAFAATTVNVMLMGEGGGEMKLSVDQPSIKGGDVVFNVANHAMTEEHEMVLVKLAAPDQLIVADTKTHRIDEAQITSLGEVAELKPSGKGTLNANLEPGSYLLLCNLKGHYEAGMWSKLTVTN